RKLSQMLQQCASVSPGSQDYLILCIRRVEYSVGLRCNEIQSRYRAGRLRGNHHKDFPHLLQKRLEKFFHLLSARFSRLAGLALVSLALETVVRWLGLHSTKRQGPEPLFTRFSHLSVHPQTLPG